MWREHSLIKDSCLFKFIALLPLFKIPRQKEKPQMSLEWIPQSPCVRGGELKIAWEPGKQKRKAWQKVAATRSQPRFCTRTRATVPSVLLFFFFCSRKSGSLIFYVNSHNFYILVFKKKKKKTTMWPNEIPLQSGSGSWAASEELSLIFLIWSIWIHFSDFPRWAGYISGARFEPQCYRGNSISKSCYNGSTQLQKSTLLRAIGMISRTLLQEHMHKF